MSEREGQGMLLGKHTPLVESYAPDLLYPIPRANGRKALATDSGQAFSGVDLWHAYELSWLDSSGKPLVRVGRFLIPADSPNMVESKSFKLYLNSLNNTRFSNADELRTTIVGDITAVAGAPVELDLLTLDDPSLAGVRLIGQCLDELPVSVSDHEPNSALLELRPGQTCEEQLYSHLLRSLCPVTGQPDWASLWLHYRGPALDHASLLRYIVAYRRHQEFHEQCVERMFCDIHRRIAPEFLHIQAFYTRRGGLDINPLRSTDPAARPLPRLNRQ